MSDPIAELTPEPTKELSPQDVVDEVCERFGKLAKELGVEVAAVISHPELEDDFTFYSCHFYDAARMIAKTWYNFRGKVQEDLNV